MADDPTAFVIIRNSHGDWYYIDLSNAGARGAVEQGEALYLSISNKKEADMRITAFWTEAPGAIECLAMAPRNSIIYMWEWWSHENKNEGYWSIYRYPVKGSLTSIELSFPDFLAEELGKVD